MATSLGSQHYALLNRLALFPDVRLTRCGASPAQLLAEAANWITHDIHWQAQESKYLSSLADPAITTLIAAWPPVVPASDIAAWPYA